MAKGQQYSAYQRGVIRRYYEHKETLMTQKLGELVSELYLCASEKKADSLWIRVEKAMTGAGVDEKLVRFVVTKRDVEWLAQEIADLF